jgi:hypothetical protein
MEERGIIRVCGAIAFAVLPAFIEATSATVDSSVLSDED